MKKILYMAAAVAAAVSCQTKNDVEVLSGKREVTVYHQDMATKTGISYEASDVSHLVWNEGDKVMYITSDKSGLYDYGFQEAVVTSNKFTASISDKAGKSDNMLVFWPSSALALGSSDTNFWMDKELTVKSTDDFNGRRLPMISMFSVPEGTEVNADYTPLASVVRVSIDSTGHAKERLLSLTITTAEQCYGVYQIATTAENGYTFKGKGNTVKVNLSDKPMLKDLKYVYMVMARASYTGVQLDIETDKTTYTFQDGKMDLSRQGRYLYRMPVTLGEIPEPEIKKFHLVTDAADVVDGGTYLITAEESAGKYYVMKNTTSNNYLERVSVSVDEDGTLPASEELLTYSLVAGKGTGDYEGRFSFKMSSLGTKSYISSPGAVSEAVEYMGTFWYKTASDLTMSNPWWKVTVSADACRIESHELKVMGEPSGRYGHIVHFNDKRAFGVAAPEADSENYREIRLFVLK